MTDGSDGSPLSSEEIAELRRLLARYREAVDQTAVEHLPTVQTRLSDRLKQLVAKVDSSGQTRR